MKIEPNEIEYKAKVKYAGDSDPLYFINGNIYDVISKVKAPEISWYRVIDETGEDYLYPPGAFEIVEE